MNEFSEILGNVRLTFGTILKNLRKSSENGRKSSENHQKRRHQYVYVIKRTLEGIENKQRLQTLSIDNAWSNKNFM